MPRRLVIAIFVFWWGLVGIALCTLGLALSIDDASLIRAVGGVTLIFTGGAVLSMAADRLSHEARSRSSRDSRRRHAGAMATTSPRPLARPSRDRPTASSAS